MLFQRSSLRYAHTTGYTGLVYTENGDFIITCGSDGDIRRWRSINDDDPTSTCLGEFVICIAHNDGKLLASTDVNTLQAYTFPDMDADGILMRFTALVTCIRCNKSYIAAGSDDTNIKVIRSGETQPSIHLEGHAGPVLSLDVSPNDAILASAAGDGQLKIWNLESGTEIKNIIGLSKANCFENATCFSTPVFEPLHGKSLAYAKGKEIYVLNTTTWEVQLTLTDERNTGYYTCCQFSQDGQYLAAGTSAGEMSVFDFVRKQTIKTEVPSSECKAITCIAWNPKNNMELAYCDATGQLGMLFASGAKGEGGSLAAASANPADVDFGDIEFDQDDEASNLADNDVHNDHFGDNDDDDDDQEDEDGTISIEKLKRKIMKKADVYGGGGSDDLPQDDDTKLSHTSGANDAAAHFLRKLFKQQTAFQPSSTPTNLEHRYLVWNDVGIVTAHVEDGDDSIDVEFHDASIHHSLHIANYNNHTMASLSSTVLAMSGENSTKLVCIALAASGNREWTMQMPDCESVEALAATSKLVAVATSMHFLRLFTVMGTQREIISIPGPVVAIAGHGDRFIVCYHSAAPSEEQQHLSAMIVQVAGMTLRTQNIPLPLPAGRQLTWLGFSDCGSPIFADTMGLLQLFSLKSHCWMPICDTMKHSQSVSNNYFIIAVSERSQIVQAVLCRGSSYPMTNPRPMMQELPMHLPNCDADTEKSDLEDALVRAFVMAMDNADKTVKETAIKLFALACRSEIEMRAKELIETIACPDLLLLAVKYASKLGRIHLSDRLAELMPHIEEQQQQQQSERQHALQEVQITPSFGHSASATTPVTSSSTKLAPKMIELSSSKRAALKRFSTNSNTPTSFRKSSILEPSLSLSDLNSDTQENMFSNDAEKITLDTMDGKESIRTPLNSVNPFASKRKLADVDKSALMGSEKLKLLKK